ncbi:MAG: hypothetical protein H7A51_15050 [Akkermansiaceae bacterium]|nr:hypothetical protein [Akkermansiaceae bacterium]
MSYTKEEADICTIYSSGRVGSGVIILGHDGGAVVIESAYSALSKITQGLRDKELVARCKGDLEPLVKAAFICHLKDTDKLCQDCEGLRTISNYVIDSACLSFGLDRSLVSTHFFENIVGEALSKAFREGGLPELETVTKVIKIAQKKNKSELTDNEKHFIDSVKLATEAFRGVPTQKTVFDLWEDGEDYNDYDVFRDVRNRLGFSWLPQGKRGKEKAWN